MFIHKKIPLDYEDLEATTSASGRVYKTPDGDFPSITSVLSILSEEAIQAWRKRVGEEEANKISYRASNRGTKVHSIIEAYLKNESVDDFMFDIRASLANLKPILNNRISEIYHLECPLYSKYLGMAGRCDCVAKFDGVPSILDWKTSRYPKTRDKIENYFMQGAGYAIMFEERTGMPITNIVIVMDVDGHPPIVFKEHRDQWAPKLIETKELYDRRRKTRVI